MVTHQYVKHAILLFRVTILRALPIGNSLVKKVKLIYFTNTEVGRFVSVFLDSMYFMFSFYCVIWV